uniref:Uncharacterized protein n=1 Tax=Lepeophtheirus salmonis TaxID=72036 RepID=A0A0K2UGG6_LEPSM
MHSNLWKVINCF